MTPKTMSHNRTRRILMMPLLNVLGTMWVFSLFFLPVAAAEEPLSQLAPVSSEFQRYLDSSFLTKSTEKEIPAFAIEEPKSTGYIPSPNDYSFLRGKASLIQHQTSPFQRLYAPLQYDLRTQGRVTPIKDQGQCGACWTFGSVASLESTLMPGETWDFSENNLKNNSGFDWDKCSGGNGDMAIAYFSRWSGPVAETDDPYSDATGSVSPAGLLPKKHVQEVLIVPGRGSSLDNDAIKQALMDYGAITTSIYVDDGARTSSNSSYYKHTNSAYYYNGTSDSNHIVAIVGWDDTYSASNFSTIPPGNGAFIVKNSWGTGWGNSGYFYISYYDSLVGDTNYLFKSATDTTLYTNIYQYDTFGKTSGSGYGSTMGWFSNIFTATQSEKLAAVSFHTNDINAGYEVFLYKGVSAGSPRSGTLSGNFTGSIPYPGYHTLTVPTPVTLSVGEKFSVVVKLTNPTNMYPIPLEGPVSGYISKATASSGQSYMSYNGSLWNDVSVEYTNNNIVLKAFTQNSPVSYSVSFNSNGGSAVNSQSVVYNSTATTPTAPTRSGYSFAGWYSDAGLTSVFFFTTAITTDTILYAKWTVESVSTKAKVYLGTADSFTISNSGATLYGSSGFDTVTIQTGVTGVILDQNVDRINFADPSGNYTFRQTGNMINVYDATAATTLSARLPVQGDTDGTQLSFSNGMASVKLISGVMKLGEETVNPNSASALSPTLTASPQITGATTKAKVYLGSADNFTVSNSGTTLYGGAGNDTVTIASGVTGVTLDQNIERVNLSGASSSYKFKQTGNIINVYDAGGATLIVKAPVQGDTDGTVLSFSNGMASTLLSGGVMKLGGVTVSSGTAGVLSPFLK